MPRPLRIHVPGGFYHVTLRGNHRQTIFFSPEDRLLLNETVADSIQLHQARMHAYCWMTNHIHMLIQVGDVPLGRTMLRIASRYARTVQKRLETTGHLFERRYHTILIDADAYLLALLRYIHRNPVAACMVASTADYPWSSHHAYIGSRQEPWVTTDFALRMFHPERTRAVASYLRFMQEAPGCEASSPFDDLNRNDLRVLGDDQFMASLIGGSQRTGAGSTLDEVLDDACQRFSVTLEDLQSSNRQRGISRVRAWVARQAVARRAASISAVARRLNRDESTVRGMLEKRTNPSEE
jgi:putative transposase